MAQLTPEELGAAVRKERAAQNGGTKKKASKKTSKKTAKKGSKKTAKKGSKKTPISRKKAPTRSHNPDGLNELRHASDVVKKATRMVEDCGISTNPSKRPSRVAVSSSPSPTRKKTVKKTTRKKKASPKVKRR